MSFVKVYLCSLSVGQVELFLSEKVKMEVKSSGGEL